MLYKNNERYTLTQKDKDFVKKEVGGKFPATIVYSKHAFTPNPNEEDKDRIDRPSKVIIPYQELVEDSEMGERVLWTYTSTPPTKHKTTGELEFHQNGAEAALLFDGRKTIGEGQMDLLFFLLKISKMNANNPKANRRLFEVYNNKAKAANEIRANKDRVLIEGMLIGEQMESADVIRLARAFGINNASEMDDSELRVELFAVVTNQEKHQGDGYSQFLDLSDNPRKKLLLECITKAKEYKLLQYSPSMKKWQCFDEKGVKIGDFCKTKATKTVEESLKIAVLEDDDLADKIVGMITEYEKQMQTA